MLTTSVVIAENQTDTSQTVEVNGKSSAVRSAIGQIERLCYSCINERLCPVLQTWQLEDTCSAPEDTETGVGVSQSTIKRSWIVLGSASSEAAALWVK